MQPTTQAGDDVGQKAANEGVRVVAVFIGSPAALLAWTRSRLDRQAAEPAREPVGDQ